MYNFEFTNPNTVEDAVKALASEGAQALGGGQTLLPTMKQRLASPEVLVSLSGVAEMKGVCAGDGAIAIGGATTHADVASEAASAYPALAALAGNIGDPAVRNRGTIGGSLANNDPAACYPAGHWARAQRSRPISAKLLRMTISKGCLRRRLRKAKSSPACPSQSQRPRTIKSSNNPPRALRWSVSLSPNTPMACVSR